MLKSMFAFLPLRVLVGDPLLEVRVAATGIVQSICKRLSIKSR